MIKNLAIATLLVWVPLLLAALDIRCIAGYLTLLFIFYLIGDNNAHRNV